MEKALNNYIRFLTNKLDIKADDFRIINIKSFVIEEVNQSPSHVKVGVKFLLILFNLIVALNRLMFKNEEAGFRDTIFFIKKYNIPLLNNLLTLFESLILLKLLDNDQ